MGGAWALTKFDPDTPIILLVEDEVLLRMLLADQLRDEGYAVIEAASGDEALSILQSNTAIELVVTDRNMPGQVDGAALARLIHAENPGLKVVMVSGDEADADVTSVTHGYFRKPCDVAALSAHLRRLASPTEVKGS